MISQSEKRFLKYKDGPERYGICESTFIKYAKEAGAVIKLGKTVLVDSYIFESYLEKFRIPKEKKSQ